MTNKFNLLIGILIGLMFVGKTDCGPGHAAIACVGCSVACWAGYFVCCGTSGAIDLALASNPITAPFVAVLTPFFASGCGAGFAACMTACVASSVETPSS